jgi:hypothetical protein
MSQPAPDPNPWWRRLPPGWEKIILALLLVLFGGIEANSVMDVNKLDEALSGMGMAGALAMLLMKK